MRFGWNGQEVEVEGVPDVLPAGDVIEINWGLDASGALWAKATIWPAGEAGVGEDGRPSEEVARIVGARRAAGPVGQG